MAGDIDALINYEESASEICNDSQNVNISIFRGMYVMKIFKYFSKYTCIVGIVRDFNLY